MTDDEGMGSGGDQASGGTVWYWAVVLMFLFMGLVVVMAIIQTQAQ